jgi:hypothetical protein
LNLTSNIELIILLYIATFFFLGVIFAAGMAIGYKMRGRELRYIKKYYQKNLDKEDVRSSSSTSSQS